MYLSCSSARLWDDQDTIYSSFFRLWNDQDGTYFCYLRPCDWLRSVLWRKREREVWEPEELEKKEQERKELMSVDLLALQRLTLLTWFQGIHSTPVVLDW